MKILRFATLLVLLSCVVEAKEALAQQHVFGTSGIVYDSANNKVKGFSRTELDYDTAAYYTAYVCGSLSKNGVEQVRSCKSGFVSASVNTQFTGAPESASITSDHYVDMQFFDEENSSYVDYSGYSFLPGYTFPSDALFSPLFIFTYHQPVSIRLGSTTVQDQKPLVSLDILPYAYSFTPPTIKKQAGPGSDTILKVKVSASDSAAFNNATVSVEVDKISGSATLAYDPGHTSTKLLTRGDFVEVEFKIGTDGQNEYTGEVRFRLRITNVVDNTTGKSISANITIMPVVPLVTAAPGQVLQIVP